MESDGSDDTSSDIEHDEGATEKNWFGEIAWQNVKDFSHQYVVTFPKDLKKDVKIECELPYPVFDPTHDLDAEGYWNPINPKTTKLDTRLKYYKKLYSQSKQKVSLKDLDKNIVEIPRYIMDFASGVLDENFNEVWYYTGGLLDCLDFNGVSYLANLIAPHTIRFAQLNAECVSSTFNVDKSSPVYSIKCNVNGQTPTVGIRQRDKIFLFQSFESDSGNCVPLWSVESGEPFIDMAFNNYQDHQFCYIDSEHVVELVDFATNTTLTKHEFPMKDSTGLSDYLAQILFLDSNTLVHMDRSCIFLLDFRSQSVKKTCLKKWLACDELCALSKKNDGAVYITSMHNITEFDLQSLKCANNVVHMMSTHPFISSSVQHSQGYYLGLVGQDINDKMLTHCNNSSTFHIPQYVSNIKDTFRIISSTSKLHFLDLISERMTLPLIGMKLHKDLDTNNVTLFTSNLVGDVFQQKILHEDFEWGESVDRLTKWIKKLSIKPRPIEVTSICNLNKAVHSITTHTPKEKNITSLLMKENTAQAFFDKNICSIQKDIRSTVGASLNTIWADDVIGQENSLPCPQHKVLEWLHETK